MAASRPVVLAAGVAIVLAIAGCSSRDRPRVVDVDLVITGATVIHPDGDELPRVEEIAIGDGRIVDVGPGLAARYHAAATYDATGRFIIPGLADLHSHFGNAILPPGEDDTRPVLARHLFFGNTTILNLGSAQAWPERIDDLRARMRDGELAGPRLLAVGSLITLPGSHPVTTIYSPELQAQIAERVAAHADGAAIDLAPLRGTTLVNTPEQIVAEVERVGSWGADAIKIIVESGPDEFGDDHPQMGPEMIAAAARAAQGFGIPLLCHISSLDELEDCLAHGAAGAVHGVTPAEELPQDLETRMAAAGFVLIPTAALFEGWIRYTEDPSLLRQVALRGVLSDGELALFSSSRMLEQFGGDAEWAASVRRLGAHIKKLHDLGGTIVAGTDTGNPYRFAGLALHEELAFYVRAGLTPREALATATVNAARFLGAQDAWGGIRPGLAADLVVLAASPLDDIGNTLSIVDVIQAGRVVDRNALPLH